MRLLADLATNKVSKLTDPRVITPVGCCLLVAISLCLLLAPPAGAQDKYLVSTNDGLLSLYDLATNTFIESVKGSLGYNALDSQISGPGVPIPGPNNRLAFDVSAAYVSTVDLTINRETNRLLRVVFSNASGVKVAATTPDGKYLLIAFLGETGKYSQAFLLYVIDASTFELVSKVDVSSVLNGYPGSVVAVANKAYVFPRAGSPTQKVAVVNLTSFAVSSIALPVGNLGYRPAVVTPDGSAVLAFEDETDNKSHLLFISTATDTLANDMAQAQRYSINAFAVSPPGTDSSMSLGFIAAPPLAYAVDLRANSQTYGQVLSGSAVSTDFNQALPNHGLAVSSDNSRLIVVGQNFTTGPNVNIIDTAKMLTDPADAIIARVTVDNGAGPYGVCAGASQPLRRIPLLPSPASVAASLTTCRARSRLREPTSHRGRWCASAAWIRCSPA